MLAVVTGGIGVGIVLWAKEAMPHDEVTEERPSVASSEEEVEAFTADLEAGAEGIGRRRLLVGLPASAFTAMGAAAPVPHPVARSPTGQGVEDDPYVNGPIRVVTEDGNPVKPSDLSVDGVITVLPEGYVDAPDAPTLLIHYRDDQTSGPCQAVRTGPSTTSSPTRSCARTPAARSACTRPTRAAVVPVPPVDVRRRWTARRPIFGPAARPLPQLPLGVDEQGYLIARVTSPAPSAPASGTGTGDGD